MMKRFVSILLAVFMVCALGACSASPETSSQGSSEAAAPAVEETAEPADGGEPQQQEGKAPEDMVIGFSIHFKTDDYGAVCTVGFEETCQDADVKYEIADANGDASKQLADIESFIAKKVDAIVVSPIDEKAIKDVCNKAADQGIAVIPITYMPDVNAVCTVETGNYEFSEEVAQKLAEAMGYEGKVAIIMPPVILYRIEQRWQAFEDVIAQYPDMELVSIEKKMEADEAMPATEALIAANPDLKAVWGTFSNPVYGAGNAIKTQNKPDIIVGGVDADTSILKLMQDNWVQFVAAQVPYSHGQLGAEMAMKYLSGEEVPDQVMAIYKRRTGGAGRTEIFRAIFGTDKKTEGTVSINGKPVHIRSSADSVANGIALIPENRKLEGLCLGRSIRFDTAMLTVKKLMRRGFLDGKRERGMVQGQLEKLRVKVGHFDDLVSSLSGGNQQKVVLAKWLLDNLELLLLDEPTRGIDVGAKQEIYRLINELANTGIAIVLVTSELPEPINLCDRVAVVREGSISSALERGELSQENIMELCV